MQLQVGDQKNLKSVGLSFEVYYENERVNVGSRDSVGPSSTGNLCSSTKGLLRAIQKLFQLGISRVSRRIKASEIVPVRPN
ncbi:unnamed protein product, partial [Vitis vinifera]|uniref:Uncharacterized protein n=1 Tax=Vitis vinifera TaxID=29760 RepID=D7TFA2_VITVI